MIKELILIALGGIIKPPKTNAEDFYNALEVDVLARTLWGEARGEGETGMRAVACVILNRARIAKEKNGYWWGNDIIQVCQKPYQFSCWNRSDPNFLKLQAVDESNPQFAAAMRIAKQAVSGRLADMTGNATHYHAKTIMPYWAKGETPSATIGNHIFYKLV